MNLRKRSRKAVRQLAVVPEYVEDLFDRRASTAQRIVNTAGWVTAGLGAVALGLIVGRELRMRYKFTHQTPYDFYSHAGDSAQSGEFGVGV